jgi:hypothetical protein
LNVFNEALIYEIPTMKNHGYRRKKMRRGWCEKWRGVGRLFIGSVSQKTVGKS